MQQKQEDVCGSCQQPTYGVHAKLQSCGHCFHRTCLEQEWYTKVMTLQQVVCPQCKGAIASRPVIPLGRLKPPPIPPPGDPYSDVHIWHNVHKRVREKRDEEVESICHGLRDYGDVERADLAPFRQQSNFFEMVQACWVCHSLLGNECWVQLAGCGHCFHAACIVDDFYTHRRPSCPLCGERQICPSTLNYDEPLLKPLRGQYRWQIDFSNVWHGLFFKIRQHARNQDTLIDDPEEEMEHLEQLPLPQREEILFETDLPKAPRKAAH